MRVLYLLSHYISHRQSGMDAIEALRSQAGFTVSTELSDLDAADAVIIHEDPECYPGLFGRYPKLSRKRSIAYCVWEGDILPDSHCRALQLVDEVWTPSAYSAASILPHISRVTVMPHVVRRIPPSGEDLAWARECLGRSGAGGGTYRFLSIVDAVNPRKNMLGLLQAFAEVYARMPDRARLVLKQYRMEVDYSAIPGVVSIFEELAPGRMAALHSLCDCYVSAHHAEGWGLGLSEAMAYGRPVIATGYSGNMEFMNVNNSFPVPFTLGPVSPAMVAKHPLFTENMRWAKPDIPTMANLMHRAANNRLDASRAAAAVAITRNFGPKAVGERMARALSTPLSR